MFEKLLLWFKKKALSQPEAEPKAESPSQESPYTDEEAQKVKERLQGLGYID